MLSNREIMNNFNLSKSQVNGIIKKFADDWRIKKDKSGKYQWSKAAISKLKNHLNLEETEIPNTRPKDPESSSKKEMLRGQTRRTLHADKHNNQLYNTLKEEILEQYSHDIASLRQTFTLKVEKIKAEHAMLHRKIEEIKTDHATLRRKIEEIKTQQASGKRVLEEIKTEQEFSQRTAVDNSRAITLPSKSWESSDEKTGFDYIPNFLRYEEIRTQSEEGEQPQNSSFRYYSRKLQGILFIAAGTGFSYLVFVSRGVSLSAAQQSFLLTWGGVIVLIFGLHPILATQNFYNNLEIKNLRFPKLTMVACLVIGLGIEPLGAMRASLIIFLASLTLFGYHSVFQK
ncbi:hypothetical protein ACFL35_03790 [Candidatus Riflebacteria bacterium]